MSNAIEDKTAAEDSTRPDAEGSSAETRQFVTFSVGKEMFGVPMDPVEEIIRVPETVRVPLSPVSLKGLANLRGKVLPVISLRHVFGLEEIADDDSTRALVIDNGTSLGFVVDRVSSVVSVDVSRIEEATDIRATVDTQLLSGMIKGDAGAPMIMILDFARLIEQEYSAISQAASRMAAQTIQQASRAASSAEAASDEVQLVSFEVAGQEYAFPIEQVQEIVQVPERISKVPNTSSHVIGVMTLRDRILPLVNLRELFALPTRDLDEHSRIVVVTIGEGNRRVSVGVAMDRVNEVLRISRSLVEAPPSLLSASGEAR
jgi:purine-binding chemotaxis protein CheW